MVEENAKVITVGRDDESTCKAVQVVKAQDVDIDVGTLLATDRNFIDLDSLRSKKDDYLKSLARDNTQLLVNAIWKLPTERVEEVLVVKLPKPTYVLPREKPVPKPRPLTKWQQFAKDKGIRQTRKSNLTWDETLKKWVPRHGYKRAAAEREKNWMVEIPDHADPYEDYFEKNAEQKKEKVAKNEFQRLRNIARAKNIKVPSMGLPPTEKLTSTQLNFAAKVANVSTASVGKFQPRLSKEKTLKNTSIITSNKRKHPPPMAKDQEHKSNLELADTILNKKPKLDLEKAVNREMHAQETQESEMKVSRQKKGRRNGGGGGGSGKKGKGKGGDRRKPSGGKGKRVFKGKQQTGRKRR